MQHLEDQIFALAPDEASKKAGIGLAKPAKWITRGINDIALWGECQGSGSKPYQTQIDLLSIAFKCSCPSRKFPCKHGLGLMLLQARQPDIFDNMDMPAWVNDWISKRTEKEVKKTESSEKPIDEAAQAKRQEARIKKVTEGIQEVLVWIKDIIRNGILNMPDKDADYWDNMARRMVDSQATGLAAMIKELSKTKYWEEGWQSKFMDRLIRLYTVAEGYKNLSTINETLQHDVLREIGFTTSQEELKKQDGTKDTWLVLGKNVDIEGQLTIEENWLYGIESGQYALILQFYARGQSSQVFIMPGTYIVAELVFFTSVIPYRAIIKGQAVPGAGLSFENKGAENWGQIAMYETLMNSKLPFHNEVPGIIKKVTPVKFQEEWWLQDQLGHLCMLNTEFKDFWKLLAISGGKPLDMAVIGKENHYMPIGVWDQNIYRALC